MLRIQCLTLLLQGRRTFLPYLGLLFITVNAMATQPQKAGEKVPNPMQGVTVSAKEYPALVKEALSGSGEAAFRLSVHYLMTGRVSEHIFWASIAAENGDQRAFFNLGSALAESRDPMQRLRARFWLNKVVASGDKAMSERAKLALKTLDAQERTNEANTAPRYGVYPKWPIE